MSVSSSLRALVPADRRLTLWALLLTLFGLALRIAGAEGDLWLDEIHSILLSQSVHRADEVFWHINHDNNHFLNTLYLFLVGPDHSSVVLRLEAIVFGTLSIPAAGLAAYGHGRRDATAAVAAMLLTATIYPAVHYGSEARGYAGLVLFSFLAIHLVEGGLKTRLDRLLLGLVTLLGVLSYLFMAFAIAAFILLDGFLRRRPGQDWFEVMARAAVPYWAAILACLTPVALIMAADLVQPYQHGFVQTAAPYRLTAEAIGRFFDLSFGFPADPAYLGGTALTLACLWITRRSVSAAVRYRSQYCLVFFCGYVAFLMIVGAPKNLDHPRYAMPMLAPLILLMADSVGIGLRHGPSARRTTIVVLAALLAGTLASLAHFYAEGRGHYSDAVLAMTGDGPATYTSDVLFGHTQLVDYYNHRLNRHAIYIPSGDMCVIPPQWLLHTDEQEKPGEHPPDQVLFGPAGCKAAYAQPQLFGYWGLAGWNWTLYRRVPDRVQR